VPHVHVHVIPRKKHDYAENDEIYHHLERSERGLGATLSSAFPKIDDKDRISRTEEDMATEAAWLAKFFKQE
jgi:bis(5'-adenosyl)-triphosphatase